MSVRQRMVEQHRECATVRDDGDVDVKYAAW